MYIKKCLLENYAAYIPLTELNLGLHVKSQVKRDWNTQCTA